MIEIQNLNLALRGATQLDLAYDPDLLTEAVCRKLRCSREEIAHSYVVKRSVDARKRSDIHFVASVRVELWAGPSSEERMVRRLSDRNISLIQACPYELPRLSPSAHPASPVVVGAGPAGLFCTLLLALAGMKPLLIEQGAPPDERLSYIELFHAKGILNPYSNIQFGAGGAGMFSDGKLTTGTHVPENTWILQTFMEAGAPADLGWLAQPHIGSDMLPSVVDALLARIRKAGGEIFWHTHADELRIENGRVRGLWCSHTDTGLRSELIACRRLVLACGHSARDILRHLKDAHITLEPKVFSLGVRIEHEQAAVNKALFGSFADHPTLGAAAYKLSHHQDSGRGIYTFCMCPGGSVVAAASEAGCLVTNGASVHARDGVNANAALLVNVYPSDIAGLEKDVLSGMYMQQKIERDAYEAAGSNWRAPAQLLGDFMRSVPSTGPASVMPSYPLGVSWGAVSECLPGFITSALKEGIPVLGKHLSCFAQPDAVLTAAETRSTSPVRIVRDQATLASVDVCGLYPAGEGAGYAGGIMSAAADGMRVARAVIEAASAGEVE